MKQNKKRVLTLKTHQVITFATFTFRGRLTLRKENHEENLRHTVTLISTMFTLLMSAFSILIFQTVIYILRYVFTSIYKMLRYRFFKAYSFGLFSKVPLHCQTYQS